MAIFRAVTPLVEPLSLDEAFLDVSDVEADAPQIEALATGLKRSVNEATGLTVSIGGGANKTVAKIASDLGKPDGLVIVPRGDEAAFLAPMSIRALWGIGPKTEAGLVRAGIRTVAELAARDESELTRLLGSRGPFLRAMALGIDERPVETSYERKSVGAETTFARDLPDGPELREALDHIAAETAQRLQGTGALAHTVAVKLRFSNFRTISRQASVKTATDDLVEITAIAIRLLEDVLRANEGVRFRLLGVQCSRLIAADAAQGRLPLAHDGGAL